MSNSISVVIGGYSEPKEPALKKQSHYGCDEWKPGEIPTRTGSLRPVITPTGQSRQPYGEFMGVQKPTSTGKGFKNES
jgi:hypothetical protein